MNSKIDALKFELKEAYLQINLLRTTNTNLLHKAHQYDRMKEDMHKIKQQLEWRRQNQDNLRLMLQQWHQMNVKLKAQLQAYQQKENEKDGIQVKLQKNGRQSTNNSNFKTLPDSSQQILRSNHPSTPKSLPFPPTISQRRQVFMH